MQEKWRLARSLWSLAAIVVAFAVFVKKNGGVVVGDKAHHMPVLHFMQVPYLLLFTAGALAAIHLSPYRYSLPAKKYSTRVTLTNDACMEVPRDGMHQHTCPLCQESTGAWTRLCYIV